MPQTTQTHDLEVSEVMTELIAEYYPGVRMIEVA